MKIKAIGLAMAALMSGGAPYVYGEDSNRNLVHVTHGVAAGDVTSHSAVIWSRASQEANMHVRIIGDGDAQGPENITVTAARDFTGKVLVDGLRPDTNYRYHVWFEDDRGKKSSVEGRFHTAPAAQETAAVDFAFSGDLAGQNVCRDVSDGFPAFRAINARSIDFFIGLGDMIYADGKCEAVGRYGNAQVPGNFNLAATMQDYWGHWKYNRDDAGYRQLLANKPYYAIWDDHEVVNDFGPLHDTRVAAPYTPGVHLLPIGRAAFLDYNPIAENAQTPHRLYRNVRWGKHLEMFILDTRQYRDANSAADAADRPKTLLGREQLEWLKAKLAASDATWKVIVSSVPMSIPTGGNGRDGWANYTSDLGFESELLDILHFMQRHGIYNNLWITTDVHFAEVFRYTPFADDPSFKVHEVVAGPVNAGLFPNRSFDDTLGTESLFFFGPNTGGAVTTWKEAKRWMNFGGVAIDEHGRLAASVNDIDGNAVYELSLMPR